MAEFKSTPLLTQRFQDATQFALDLHKHQTRKTTGAPYASHLLSVCGLVLAHGGDEDEAIAALLHDSLEDHPDRCSPELIARCFGERVLALVLECTDTHPSAKDGGKAPWLERKQAFLERLRTQELLGPRILLADKTDNLRATLFGYQTQGEQIWSYFRANREQQIWYFQSFFDLIKTKTVPPALLSDFEQVLAHLLLLMKERNKAA